MQQNTVENVNSNIESAERDILGRDSSSCYSFLLKFLGHMLCWLKFNKMDRSRVFGNTYSISSRVSFVYICFHAIKLDKYTSDNYDQVLDKKLC